MPSRKGKSKYATRKDVKNIERRLQGETKTFVTSSTETVIHPLSATPIRNPMPLILLGSGAHDREGQIVRIKKFSIKGILKQNTLNAQENVRIVIFRDKQCLGNLPTMGELLYSTVAERNMVTHMSTINEDRFSIMYDKLFCLTVTDKIEVPFSFTSKENYNMVYKGSGGGVLDFNGSGYFLYAWSDVTNTNYAKISYSVRFDYIDN